MSTWLDYSGGTIPGAQLAAAGIEGVFRYVGIGSGPKRLTAGELADLQAHGIQVRGIAESTANESNNGYNAGLADGKAVLADPVTASLSFVYATDDQPAWGQANVDYVRGFRDAVGQTRTGAYGFGPFLAAVHAIGLADSYWQAGAPPSQTGGTGWVDFWQRQGSPYATSADGPANPASGSLAGVGIDYNNRLITETGAAPDMTTEEHAWLEDVMRRTQQMHTNGYLALPMGPDGNPVVTDWRAGGDLAYLQTQLGTALAPVLAAVKAVPSGGTITDAQLATLTTALEAALPSYTVAITRV